MMPTIKDVAEKAGVGIATVSRAMNGTGYVSARSREKIETAIRELHYIPNERARNLSRKQTGIIGVLIPDFQTPFYASFLRQVEMELYNYGYRTMVCNTVKHSDREAAYVEMLDRNMLDGLITCAWSAEAEVYRHMDKPIVSMDHNLGEGIPLIHSDHKTGGRIAAEHLLEKGCKRVLQLGDYFPVYTPSNDRYAKLYKGRKQTVKRAADNKQRYAPGEGSIPPVLLSDVSSTRLYKSKRGAYATTCIVVTILPSICFFAFSTSVRTEKPFFSYKSLRPVISVHISSIAI